MSPEVAAAEALDAYVLEVRSIVERNLSAERTAEAVVVANRQILKPGFRLPDALRKVHPTAAYSRNLVYQDPKNRLSVIALVWGPFQETRVHDHLNWCVMNILEGSTLSLDYDRLDDETKPEFAELRLREATVAKTGTVVGLTPPPRTNIHRIANAEGKISISLHTYGDPGTKARVFDPANKRVEIVDLVFHNL